MKLEAVFSEKQLDFLWGSDDAPINISEGAVRSGKTYSQFFRFLEHVATHDGPFLITGKTQDTIRRNLLSPMADLFGADRIQHRVSRMEATIAGKTCYLVSANDEGSETRLRGLTVQGWLADEITLHPKSFTDQGIARCSLRGSRIFWSCNPDSPYHYIKTQYVDGNPSARTWHWVLDDNTTLDPAYVQTLKDSYTGLFYRRFILGEWVLAEGTVYEGFDESRHVVAECPFKPDRWVVGADYGTINPCVFLLVALKGDRAHVAREWYYEPGNGARQLTDSDYADAYVALLREEGLPLNRTRAWVDPSAASFRVELERRGADVAGADNSVLDGIRVVASLLTDGRLTLSPQCRHLRQQFASYVWDDKAALSGQDRPLKVNDHAPDALRYAIYSEFSHLLVAPRTGKTREIANVARRWCR